jgi:hypothetical protein
VFGPTIEEVESGPYYVQLGSARSLVALRAKLQAQFECSREELRLERVIYKPVEGKGKYGCPVAKYIVRRQSLTEKYLAVIKERKGHR